MPVAGALSAAALTAIVAPLVAVLTLWATRRIWMVAAAAALLAAVVQGELHRVSNRGRETP